MTQQPSTTDERAASTTQRSDVSVTMIATPGDASCGIGTYGRDLRNALDDVEADDAPRDPDDSPGSDDAAATDGGATVSSDGSHSANGDGTRGSGGGTRTNGTGVATSGDVTRRNGDGTGTNGDGTGANGRTKPADGGATTDAIELEQDEPTARHFLSVALRAAARDSDVVHVQHEYGLFRRPGSIYPGLLGLVFFPVLWLATRARGKSLVVTLHSMLTPSPAEAPFSKRVYLLAMHELIARVADHVIFLSEDCEERFHDDVDQDPDAYSVLPHGVNVQDSSPVDQRDAREQFGFAPDDRIVTIPGFIRPPKGHDIFVAVAKELSDVEFLIAGGARSKGFDQEFVEELEADAPSNVTITGVLDDEDFPVALTTADLALLPYRVVTQSGTFNWCAAQELPILGSDRSYFRRIEAEWDALETVEIDDPETIADRVEALLGDDARREELSANVRRFKEANSFEAVAGQHVEIYRSIAPDGRTVGVETESDATETQEADDEPLLAACSAQREAPATSD